MAHSLTFIDGPSHVDQGWDCILLISCRLKHGHQPAKRETFVLPSKVNSPRRLTS